MLNIFSSLLFIGFLFPSHTTAKLGRGRTHAENHVSIGSGNFACPVNEGSPEYQAFRNELHYSKTAATDYPPDAILPINTYFHVVTSPEDPPEHNVTEALIQKQYKYLREAFVPHGIEILLLETTWTVNKTWSEVEDQLEMSLSLRRGPYRALNIYFLSHIKNNLGIASLPYDIDEKNRTSWINDAVLVHVSAMPGSWYNPIGQGRVAIHEVGHWLGLQHVFMGSCCDCPGDYIDDTPPQQNASWGCPDKQDSCPDQPGLDSTYNYMDYSTEGCAREFTKGQRQRMFEMYYRFRNKTQV